MGSINPQRPKRADARQGSAGPQRRCPICTAPAEPLFRPFCSRRCADVDLSRWLRGGYAIPGRADVDEDGDDTIANGAAQRGARGDGQSEEDG